MVQLLSSIKIRINVRLAVPLPNSSGIAISKPPNFPQTLVHGIRSERRERTPPKMTRKALSHHLFLLYLSEGTGWFGPTNTSLQADPTDTRYLDRKVGTDQISNMPQSI